MKIFLIFLVLCSISATLISQTHRPSFTPELEKRNAITIGVLNGGGGLVGADFEFLVSDQVGLQVGASFVGFGGGINYHFKPSIRSSFLSVQYWNQGLGEGFVQSALGPLYVFRGKKWFTFQIGMGALLREGPMAPDFGGERPPVMFLYSIGGYIPI